VFHSAYFGNCRASEQIGCALLYDLGHQITSVSADDKDGQFFLQ